MNTLAPTAFLLCLLMLAGCIAPAPTRSFEPVGQVTRMTIHVRGHDRRAPEPNESDKTITDAWAIESIVAFINEERLDWGGRADVFGVPVPNLVVYLYDGSRLKGHFGVRADACEAGRSFFETDLVKPFASKPASRKRCQQFLALLSFRR